MIKFEIGKLYVNPVHNFLLFPTKEKARKALIHNGVAAERAGDTAELRSAELSKSFGYKVLLTTPGTFFMVTDLEKTTYSFQEVTYPVCLVQIISTDGKLGWINVVDWMFIEELKA